MDHKKTMFVKYKKASGFTLIELLIALVILGVLISLVAPFFQEALERRRLESAGEDLISAVRLARSEAVKQGADVRIMFANSGSGWCYGIDDDLSNTCNCTADPTNCTVDGVERVRKNNMTGSDKRFRGIDLKLDVAGTIGGNDIVFDSGRGFVSDADTGRIHVQSSQNAMCVVVNRVGRISMISDLYGFSNDSSNLCEHEE